VESDSTDVAVRTAETQRWQTSLARPCLSHWDSVRPAQWNSLADAATRAGMRLRHDMLAKATWLAGALYLGSDSVRPAGLAGSPWANRTRWGNSAPRHRPDCVLGDRGYDAEAIRQGLLAFHIVPRLAERNIEHGSGLGRRRWVWSKPSHGSNQFRATARALRKTGVAHNALAPC